MKPTLKSFAFLAIVVSAFKNGPSFGVRYPKYLNNRITGTPTANSLPPSVLLSSTKSAVTEWSISSSPVKLSGGNSRLFSISDVSAAFSIELCQKTEGPTLRSFIPSLLSVKSKAHVDFDKDSFFSAIEEALKQYLDAGGRSSRLTLAANSSLKPYLVEIGFLLSESTPQEVLDLTKISNLSGESSVEYFSCSAQQLKNHCVKRLKATTNNPYTLHDIIGRISHDLGDLKASVESYTSALIANPKSAATFRNLGSAYHAKGDMQMAFASYQQAIQLDPSDFLVYLKLAFFYEEFATKDWVDAAEHSQRCYQYYLDNLDPTDTSVLTRLGNLLVREHKSEEAIAVYEKVLSLDQSLHNVWFNKAHAQMKVRDTVGASESLRRTLQLDPTVTAARHMLKALSEDEAVNTAASEDAYIRDLFNSYAQVYDDHGKKLLYSAPRVIRQELAKIYRAKLGADFGAASLADLGPQELEDAAVELVTTSPAPGTSFVASETQRPFEEAEQPVGSSCSSYTSFVNSSLDILDLGCGTGLAGAWLKDYARTLVGVDLSDEMVNVARKKMLYTSLTVQPIQEFLKDCDTTFDIVVAADVLSYIGELAPTIAQAAAVLRPGGHLVFTVEATPDNLLSGRGYRLLQTGRFGYTRAYLDGLVKSLGDKFSVAMAREFSPRLDAGDPVPGYLYIVARDE